MLSSKYIPFTLLRYGVKPELARLCSSGNTSRMISRYSETGGGCPNSVSLWMSSAPSTSRICCPKLSEYSRAVSTDVLPVTTTWVASSFAMWLTSFCSVGRPTQLPAPNCLSRMAHGHLDFEPRYQLPHRLLLVSHESCTHLMQTPKQRLF
ncbi:MAG: hypothetical protein J07HQW2_00589 [Haloquadratum walsbyi J07HQW2]|uniref:Uncharacterized protein n=1 Tax=Haloquadratum walsbyi J07HQW2 TaxID=1238425 RepID=U1NB96_9EURY|nr:MAG: hypothetical protein J07HQW2_00589 [Haloquadratum walsbyi J07HQW2]